MGADLICFIVKGPHKLRKTDIKKAEKAATEVIAVAKEWHAKAYPSGEIDCNVDFDEIYDDSRLRGRVERNDFAEALDFIHEYHEADPKKAVQDFIDIWPGGGRDSDWRIDPDDKNKVIMVAGDMSWGDEPDGLAYQGLKQAFRLGIAQACGIS